MDDIVASSPADLPRQTIVGEFLLDRETIRVWRKDKPLQLSMRQFRLLDLFMRQPDTALSFRDLRIAIWGPSSTIGVGTVVAEINRLRNVIGFRYGKNPIKTVRRVGFMFESQPSRPGSRRATRPSREHASKAAVTG